MLYPIKLKLTKVQKIKLAKGQSVQIHYSSMGVGDTIHIGKRMLNKLKKAKALKKGCRIYLSSKEIKRGGDFWGDLWGGIKSVGREVVKYAPEVIGLAKEIIPMVQQVQGMGRKRTVKRGGQALDSSNFDLSNFRKKFGLGRKKKKVGRNIVAPGSAYRGRAIQAPSRKSKIGLFDDPALKEFLRSPEFLKTIKA